MLRIKYIKRVVVSTRWLRANCFSSVAQLELRGHIFWGIFLELLKRLFFLSGQALTLPPPLSGRTTKNGLYFFRLPFLSLKILAKCRDIILQISNRKKVSQC